MTPLDAEGRAQIIGDIRVPRATWVAFALTMAAFGGWLWVERDFAFRYDEWDFVLHQPTDPGSYFAPHNEHWSTVPLLIYQLLLGTVGMRSHVPYMAVLLLLHVISSLLVFRIVRRRAGDLLALAAVAVLLVFGWGADEFMWAFQISWQASIIAGLMAIDLVESSMITPRRSIAVAGLLVVSVAGSGIGLAFVVAAAVGLALTPSRRAGIIAVVPAVVAYVVWYAVIGRHHATPISLSGLAVRQLAAYVVYGAGSGAAALSGIGSQAGTLLNWVAIVPLVLVTLFGCIRRRYGQILGPLAGVATLLVLAGAVRVQQFGVEEAASSRYLYVVAIFLLLLAAVALSMLPWNRLVAGVIAALTVIAVAGNLRAAGDPIAYNRNVSAVTVTDLRVLNAIRGTPNLDLTASPNTLLMPQLTVGAFYNAEDRLGSPVKPATLESLMRSDPEAVRSVLGAVLQR